jgi:glycosyltransferase involved in cell wall biosynthesis
MSAAELVSLLPSLPRSELVLLTTSMTRPAVTNAVSAAVAHHPVAHRVRLVDVSEVADDGVAPQGGMLPGLLRSADVVVTTGDDEPELDLALQAMACGVPVVARSAGAMSAVVADGVTGVLVGGVAPDALGDAARALLGDDLQLESFGFAAGDRARAAFGWPSVAAMVARVAGEVARGSHPDVVATGRAATEDHGGDDLWRDALSTS